MATKMTLQERLVGNLKMDLDYTDSRIAKFMEIFAADPAYAFEWSHDYFDVAATKKVVSTVQHGLDRRLEKDATLTDEQVVEFCVEWAKELTERAMDEARCPSRSSSMQSNLMAQSLMAKRLDIAQKLERIAKSV